MAASGPQTTRPWRAMLPAVMLFIMLVAVACPIYEDGYTGHYQEANLGELQDEAVAVDLFRFGDEVRAVLRHYSIASSVARDAPFDPSRQVRCRWSRVGDFNEDDRSFSLVIPATARYERIELQGQLDEDGNLDLEIDEAELDEIQEVRLARSDVAPQADCITIDDFFVRAIFSGGEFNGFDPSIYEIRHPVFALLWVGVEPVNHGGFIEYVALDRIGLAIRLQEGRQFAGPDNELIGNLSVSAPPPGEQILVESGDTRYALAHFVVIDDSDDEEERFSWGDASDEPIVATALEEGHPDDAPEHLQEIDRWGKALLFVEGRLDELDARLLDSFGGLGDAETNRHFYIVDVFSYDDQVVALRLPARPEAEQPVQRRVSVQVTEEYLHGGTLRVPRLFPFK